MKYILIFCLSLFGFTNAFPQATIHTDTDKVFMVVQTKPKFPGDVNKYLADNTQYPADAEKNNIQGTVFVSFVIEKDGSVSTVKILRSVAPSLDKEAIRVVSSMPKWTPGMQNGHTVRVAYNLPLRFVLSDDKAPASKKN